MPGGVDEILSPSGPWSGENLVINNRMFLYGFMEYHSMRLTIFVAEIAHESTPTCWGYRVKLMLFISLERNNIDDGICRYRSMFTFHAMSTSHMTAEVQRMTYGRVLTLVLVPSIVILYYVRRMPFMVTNGVGA
ncbi:hypothetical protein ACJX0J_036823 [Zea mays]